MLSICSIFFQKQQQLILIFSSTFPLVQKIQDSDTLDELFIDLDQNGDLEIDFKEFITLIAMVSSACHELFVENKD